MDLRLNIVSSETSRPKRRNRRHLFQKILSPTDVGVSGKYVFLIPRRFAKRYFSDVSNSSSNTQTHIYKCFEDPSGKRYRFRYRFEKLNNSFVFGAGWRDFVKDKMLREGDLVCFDEGSEGELYIRCTKEKETLDPSQVPGSSTMTSIASSSKAKAIQAGVEIMDSSPITVDSELLARIHLGYFSQFLASSTSSRTEEQVHQDNDPEIPSAAETVKLYIDDYGQTHSTGVPETVKLFGVNISCSKL